MPTTIREQIVSKIKSRLERVTIANGYRTNAGKHVLYGPLADPLIKTLPLFVFYDREEQIAPEWGTNSRVITLIIEGYQSTRNVDNPAIANKLIADVDRALYRDEETGDEDWTFEGLVQKIQFRQSTLLLSPSDVPMAGVLSEYQIIYRQVLGDPYRT
jgi:hypothetical protein